MKSLIDILYFWLPRNLTQLLQLTVALILTYVVLKAIQLFQTRQKLLKDFRDFPGPPSHWLYGNSHMLKGGEELRNLVKWTEEYPYNFPLWFGGFLAFLGINHPESAKLASRGEGRKRWELTDVNPMDFTGFSKLMDSQRKFINAFSDPKCLILYNFAVPWIGKGLLVLNGPKWQQHRKLLTPGFHYEILKSYVTPIMESVKVMLENWEKLILEDPEESLEIHEHVSLMTLDSIMKCAFSCQSNCQTDRENPYIKAIFELTFLVYQRAKTPFYHSDLIYWFTSSGRRFRKACRLAHLHTDKVIRERVKVLQDEQKSETFLKKRRLDFLDILLQARDEKGNPLPHEDLRAEVDTFMFTGHDTTASGISWLFYCMAQNPEHQERCREEIKEVLGDQETIQWDDLGKMPYVTMCIKESLRLYSVVPLISRELESPLTLDDGKTLSEGCLIGLNIFGLHRNREVWDNPEVFDPMRFSPENSHLRHPFAYLPFSAGPRNCIGQQFALIEMKVVLALTLLHFELEPDPANPPVPVAQIVTRSENGIHLKLKKRL